MKKIITSILLAVMLITGCGEVTAKEPVKEPVKQVTEVPEYNGNAYTVINENTPEFSEKTTKVFTKLSELDSLGRCGVAYGCYGPETIAEGKRGAIGHIRPSGWKTVKYPDLIDGNYLYNRCHLIMWKLSGILDDERNLITGTRYMNTEGMLPFEEKIVDYVEDTGHHVMYRVTPVYHDDELIARGVQMEAQSVEDNKFKINVYCYNIQPGIEIDYQTGESKLADEIPQIEDKQPSPLPEGEITYILNRNSQKFHLPDCKSVSKISVKNREEYKGNREYLLSIGYEPCKNCNP